MKDKNKAFDELTEIRSMMEKSTRFLSLSGFSGISAGIVALLCTFTALLIINNESGEGLIRSFYCEYRDLSWRSIKFLLLDGVATFFIAFLLGFLFTKRKASKNNQRLLTKPAIRMFINLAIPLLTGSILGLYLMINGDFYLIAPIALIFYGLALLNGSRDTFREIRYLGISEIILGLISLFLSGYGLLFWAIGFGVLHIVYGSLMYVKYDR